ncbi:MAG: hypothetical protein WA188_11770 [Terriglobales bacterium]
MTSKLWIAFVATQLLGMLTPALVNFHADAEVVLLAWLLLMPGFGVYYFVHYCVINELVSGGVAFYVPVAYLVAVPINALFWMKVASWRATRRRAPNE